MASAGASVTIVARSLPAVPVMGASFVSADFSTIAGCRVLVEKLKNEQYDTIYGCVGTMARAKLTRTVDGIEEDFMVSYCAYIRLACLLS